VGNVALCAEAIPGNKAKIEVAVDTSKNEDFRISPPEII